MKSSVLTKKVEIHQNRLELCIENDQQQRIHMNMTNQEHDS